MAPRAPSPASASAMRFGVGPTTDAQDTGAKHDIVPDEQAADGGIGRRSAPRLRRLRRMARAP